MTAPAVAPPGPLAAPDARPSASPPVPVAHLERLVGSVLATAAGTMRTRRAARRLTGGPGALQQTVVALSDSEHLGDHACGDAATLQVLAGRVVLDVGGARTLLERGAWTTVPAAPHRLEAVGDAAVLVTTLPAADPRRHRGAFTP